MKTVTDQLGRTVSYTFPPQKIISFPPAITETLFSLGLQNEILGRTRFCIHSKGIVEKAVNVGGTKDLAIERIRELNTDLIIVEKEENTIEIVEELETHYPVYWIEVQAVTAALQVLETLGCIMN